MHRVESPAAPAVKPGAQGSYQVEHLRPKTDDASQAKFWPLWNERCAIQERKAALETQLEALAVPLVVATAPQPFRHVFAAPLHGLKAWLASLGRSQEMLEEVAEYQAIVGQLKELSAREQALTTEMRPFQDLLYSGVAQNVVTDVGARDLLDKYFKGSAYTQTMRMGLKGTGTAVVGDTQASHAGWLEQGLANAPVYTGNRPSQTFNAASGSGAGSRSSATPTQSFSITSSGTVHGCFINNGGSATKDDTTGILFSAGDFSGGSRAVINGDTLNVTYTLSL